MPNGLKVRVLEDSSLPIAAYFTLINAGSRYERPGRTGVSHFLEHMMFRGSKRFPKSAFDSSLEAAGGSSDAYTRQDITAYFEEIPTRSLQTIIDLEAARLRGLLMEEEAVENERAVIREERRGRIDSNVWGRALETLAALVFQSHPYRWPVIGFPDDIETLSREDMQHYYSERYGPATATIWVAGDVDAEEVVRRIERAYGALRSPALPTDREVKEPPQLGPRHAELHGAYAQPVLAVGVHAPKASDPRSSVLDVLDLIFAATDASPLRQSLIGDRATTVESTWQACQQEGMYALLSAPAEGVTVEQLQDKLFAAFAELPRHVTPELVARAKARLKAMLLQIMDSRLGRVNAFAEAEALTGELDAALQRFERLESVTAESVSELAESLFAPSGRSTVWMVPE